MLSLLLPILAGPSAFAGDCSAATTTADLLASLDQAKNAYGELDVEGFQRSVGKARGIVPCLNDELSRHLAAELHRAEGMLAFVDRAPDRSTTAFAAARAIEPNYRFPESLVPAGNPMLLDYDAVDADSGRMKTVPEPMSGRLAFDGRTGAQRPETFPTVVQLVDENGAIVTTAYLWPSDALPKYLPKPASAVSENNGTGSNGSGGDVVSVVNRGPNKNFLIGAGVSAAVAGAFYGGAFAVHGKYQNVATPIGKLDGLRSTNNGLVLASTTSALVAVGLGTSAFFVARF